MAGSGRGHRRHGGGAQANPAHRAQAPTAPSLDAFANEPVCIYPLDRSRAAASSGPQPPTIMQALAAVPKQAVLVGVLCTNAASYRGVFTLVNRLIGRHAFQESDVKETALSAASPLPASIHLFFDDRRSIAFVLGVAKPEALFLAHLAEGSDEGEMGRDLEAEMVAFVNARRKLELLMHTCTHVLFQLNARGTFTSHILKETRALANDKQSLLAQLHTATAKPAKPRQDKTIGGGGPSSASTSSTSSSNVFAPGRCVPIVMFVVPVSENQLMASSRPLMGPSPVAKSKSSTAAYCKTQENMLCTLFRSLRGGLVGIARARDAVTASNLSKERRVFQVDPTHCVAVVAKASVSESGSLEHRLSTVLDSFSFDFLTSEIASEPDLDAILQPLHEDDLGFPQIVQHMNRCVDLVQNVSASPPVLSATNKDAANVRADLLTLGQWLKAFQTLVKTLYRMELKKKQETETTDATRQLFDHIQVRA